MPGKNRADFPRFLQGCVETMLSPEFYRFFSSTSEPESCPCPILGSGGLSCCLREVDLRIGSIIGIDWPVVEGDSSHRWGVQNTRSEASIVGDSAVTCQTRAGNCPSFTPGFW